MHLQDPVHVLNRIIKLDIPYPLFLYLRLLLDLIGSVHHELLGRVRALLLRITPKVIRNLSLLLIWLDVLWPVVCGHLNLVLG